MMRKKLAGTGRKAPPAQSLMIKQVLPEELEFWKDYDLNIKNNKRICSVCQ
jgi:hypothetical protein